MDRKRRLAYHESSSCLETSGPGSHARRPAAWEPPLLGFPDRNESRRIARIHVRRDECKGCRFCVVICPKQVYEMTDRYNVRGYRVPEVCDEAACVACQRCETICPELAIHIESV